ncbi:putative nuclease HARBI1, partial [Stegodyphus mimosarum]
MFRSRKGFLALNVQTVCDADLYVRNIVARWPGSTHDMTVFSNSYVHAKMEADVPPEYHLIGDSGYGCRTYLLTPYLDPTSEGQRRYNNSHIYARNTVERQYGVWKRRFSCIGSGLRCKVENATTIIVATVVLHNIALQMNDFF